MTTLYTQGDGFSYSEPYSDNLPNEVDGRPDAKPDGTDVAGYHHSLDNLWMKGGKFKEMPDADR